MKNSIFALLPISLALGVLFGVQSKVPEQLHGYNGVKLGTMDIDLNDTSDQKIRDYYADLLEKSSSERKGTNLLKNLKPLLSDGQLYFDYDADSLWKLYEISDRDWEKSGPTFGNNGTYNPDTNIIKDYKFGLGSSDNSKNPYIHALYMDRTIDNPVRAWGNHQQDGVGINQEHIWAKSHGFDTVPSGEAAGGARGDPMHLWAGNGYANLIHSNDYFGYVDKEKSVRNTKDKYSTVGENFSGTSLTIGSNKVFEPQDSDKGDIARALFYMAARYNNYAGAGKSEINGNEPNLVLNDKINLDTGTSTFDKPFSMGVLSDLLEWNKIDPPDEYEIHRNNLLFTNFTHNRNPFIDFPDWADIAFGESPTRSVDPLHDVINGFSAVKTLLSISVTTQPTKTSYLDNEYFDPAGMVVKANYDDGTSVVVNDYTWSPTRKLLTTDTSVQISYGGKTNNVNISVKSSIIHPNSISISPDNFELEIDSSRRLTATVLPEDTTEKGVTWTSSNDDVAIVNSSGYVTAVGPGTATITATTKDKESSVRGTCQITVPEPIVLSSITLSGTYKKTFYVNEPYTNDGIKVTAHYKQGNVEVLTEDVTEYCDFSGFDSSSVKQCTIDVEYQGFHTTYKVNIIKKDVIENTVIFNFDSYGYTNAEKVQTVSEGSYTISFFGPKTDAAYYNTGTAIRVYHENSFTITGDKKIVNVEFTYGSGDSAGSNRYTVDTGTVDPLTGEWNKEDGADSITFTLTGSTSGHRRIKSVKVVYNPEKLSKVSLLSISIGNTQKTQFYKGDAFDSSGLVVTAHYSDSSNKVVNPTNISGYNMNKTGNQKVTVTYTEGEISRSAVYEIKVNTVYITSIEVSGEYKSTFVVNEAFSHEGLVVTANQNNGSALDVTSKCTIYDPGMTTIGTKNVEVYYSDSISTSYQIEVVSDPTVPVTEDKTIADIASDKSWVNGTKYQNIELDSVLSVNVSGGANSGKYYTSGNEWRIYQNESPVISVNVDDGYKLEEVVFSFEVENGGTFLYKGESVASGDAIKTGCQRLVFYVGNSGGATNGQVKIKSIKATYIAGLPYSHSLEKIEKSGTYKTAFEVGDPFNSDGLIVTAQYNDGERAVIEPTLSGYDSSIATTQTIYVSYTKGGITKTTTYQVTVTEVIPLEIILSGTFKRDFIVGDDFTYEGLVVTCKYSNNSSAKVFDYNVSGYDKTKPTTQVITVIYQGLKATYTVDVYPVTPDKLEITTEPTKKNYFVGDTFSSSGIVAKCTYNNKTTSDVSSFLTYSGYDMSKDGEQTVTARYTEGNNYVEDTFIIFVSKIELESIKITKKPGKTTYFVGDSFNSEGLEVTAYYNNLSNKIVTPTSITGYDLSKAGKQTVIVSYTENNIEKSDFFYIDVSPVYAETLTLSGNYKTEYFVGDEFSSKNLIVTAHFNNDSSKEVTPTRMDGYDMSVSGEQTVKVWYGDVSTEYIIYLEEVVPQTLSFSGDFKKEYLVDDPLDFSNLKITVSYNNGAEKIVQPDDVEFTGYNMKIAEEQKNIHVIYNENGNEVSGDFQINVSALTPQDLVISGDYKTSFAYGEDFDSTGLIATVTYDNGKSVNVEPEITGYDNYHSGEQTIYVSYKENSTTVHNTYEITVGDEPLDLSSISLSGSFKKEYFVDDEFSIEGLIVTANYTNADPQNIGFSEVTITGYDLSVSGEQTVTVSYQSKEATYTIFVKALTPESLVISGAYQTVFAFGEKFNSNGLVATVYYDNGSSKNITPEISGYDTTQSGQQTITVSYKENGKIVENYYEITVKNEIPVVTSITLYGNYKTEFYVGDDFTSEGLKVTAHYSDGSSKEVVPTEINGYDKNKVGPQTITVVFDDDGTEVSKDYEINVLELKLTSIEVSGNYKKEYEYGEPFSMDNFVVFAYYNNSTSKVVVPSSISGFNSSKVGNQTITVSYKENGIEKSTSFVVTVKDKENPGNDGNKNVIILSSVVGGITAAAIASVSIGIGVHKKHKKLGK